MDKGPQSKNYFGNKGVLYMESYFERRNARMDPAAEFNNIDRDYRRQFMKAQKLSPNDQATGKVFVHFWSLSSFLIKKFNQNSVKIQSVLGVLID